MIADCFVCTFSTISFFFEIVDILKASKKDMDRDIQDYSQLEIMFRDALFPDEKSRRTYHIYIIKI